MAADMSSVVEYLDKKHGIEEELFKRIHDIETVIQQVGLRDADEELNALNKYSVHLKKMNDGMKKKLFKKDAKLLKLQQQEMSLEHTLVKLLKKIVTAKDEEKATKLFEAIDELIERLQVIIKSEKERSREVV